MYTGQFFRMTVECSPTVSSFRKKSGGSLIGEVLDLSETVLSNGPLFFHCLNFIQCQKESKQPGKSKCKPKKKTRSFDFNSEIICCEEAQETPCRTYSVVGGMDHHLLFV